MSRRRWRSDRGSVTAEFAVLLPAVLACLALCVGAVSGSVQLGALTAAAAAAARLAGRGDDPAAAPVPTGAGVVLERDGSVICARVTAADDTVLSRMGIRLRARACALDEGAEQ